MMNKIIRKIIFGLIVLFSIVNSGWWSNIWESALGVATGNELRNSQVASCDFGLTPTTNEWISLSIVSLALGIVFSSAIAILSGAFSIQKYNEYTKASVWNLLENAILLSILIVSFSALGEFGSKNIDTARTYSALIRNTIALDFQITMVATTVFSFIGKQTFQPRFPAFRAFGISFQMMPIFRPIFDALGIIIQLLAAGVTIWTGNEFLLCFLKSDMLNLIIPLGFFLRAFGIRGGGNAIIGVGITLFFVYPFMINVVGQMISEYYAKESQQLSFGCFSGKPICCILSYPEESLDKPFIPNGPNWKTSSNDRLSQEKIIKGSAALFSMAQIFMSPIGVPSTIGTIVTEPYCFYNTQLSALHEMFVKFIDNIGGFGSLIGLGGVAFLSSRTLPAKLANISGIIAFLYVSVAILFSTIYDLVFFIFLASILLPIFVVFISLTVGKEITKTLGSEIDLSSLEKLI
jgi:hypothetical protein